eukprot:m.183797 g.183797  ORF g.183797 m.183797 type:complete len:82 (+) comp14699_c0_seq1:98-343(+)
MIFEIRSNTSTCTFAVFDHSTFLDAVNFHNAPTTLESALQAARLALDRLPVLSARFFAPLIFCRTAVYCPPDEDPERCWQY